MKKKLAVLAAFGIIVGALVTPSTANAATAGAAVAVCNTQLPLWPTSNGSAPPCTGTAVGAFSNGVVAAPGTVTATVDSYNEACVAGEPPLVGFASGTISVTGTGTVSSDYQWTRVGAVAIIRSAALPGLAGAAVFAPTPPLGTCAAPGPLNVNVVGVAAVAQP